MKGKTSETGAIPEKWGTGNIITKPGSNRWYFDFYYFGHRVEISTGKEKTEANYAIVRGWLDRQMIKINDNTFSFSDCFTIEIPAQALGHHERGESFSPYGILQGLG